MNYGTGLYLSGATDYQEEWQVWREPLGFLGSDI